MAPKARGSITDFFGRAPALSQTWTQLDEDSDDETRHPRQDAGGKPAASPAMPANPATSPFVPSSLVYRDSPRAQRTTKLANDAVPLQPALSHASSAARPVSTEQGPSSTSPLSSMRDPPPSSTSFASQVRSSNSSSRRTVDAHGHELVRGSDEDSDASLEDLDELLARRRPQRGAVVIKQAMPQATPQARKAVGPRAAVRGEQAEPVDARTAARERMARMRMSVQVEREKQERMALLTRKLQDKSSVDIQGGDGAGKLQITEDLIKASGMNDGEGGEEQVKRTMDAMKRIEALQQDIIWRFFKPEVPQLPMAKFPTKSLSKDAWMLPLKSQEKRDAAFQSGYVQRLAKIQALPIEVQDWLYEEICGDDESDDLVMAYIATLESSCERFTNHLRPDKLRHLFTILGARDVAVNVGKVEEELQVTDTPPRAISPNIRWLVELVRRLAPTLHGDTAKLAIQLLSRLAIDDSVSKNTVLRILVEKTLDALINSFAETVNVSSLQEIACTLFNSTRHPTLRSKLVDSLPPSSPRAHFFRRHVALAFALDKTPNYGTTFDNAAIYSHVILFLENCKDLRIKPSTDYTLITAIIHMLDVAIDEGFARPAAIAAAPSALEAEATATQTRLDFFKPTQPRTHALAEPERQFNKHIDSLVQVLERLRDAIVTTGATHISRLEARSAIERLLQRLRHGVRTRVARQRDVYSGIGAQTVQRHAVGGANDDAGAQRHSANMDVGVDAA